MVYFGNDGKTKQQLKQTVFKNLDDDAIAQNTGSTVTQMEKSYDQFTLVYANRLYASKVYELNPTYVSKLQRDYRSDIKKVHT